MDHRSRPSGLPDPLQAWNLTGDVFATHPGDRPWISEMYGYSFAAAKADVWHKSHLTAMIYPGDHLPTPLPAVNSYWFSMKALNPKP